LSKLRYPGLPTEDYTVTNTADLETAVNDIPQLYQARFTSYGTAEVTVNDSTYAGQEVLVTLDRPLRISDVQVYVLSNENRSVCMDTLIYAFIPCYISVTVNAVFAYPADTSLLTAAVSDYIHQTDRVTASEIIDIIHNYDYIRYIQLPVAVTGTLYKPDGTAETLNTGSEIKITADYRMSLSSNTVSYFCDEVIINAV